MRMETIRTEDGLVWVKHHLTPWERVKRFGRLLPDLFIPDFWDGKKMVYDSVSGRLETFYGDLKAGLLGYWVGVRPE